MKIIQNLLAKKAACELYAAKKRVIIEFPAHKNPYLNQLDTSKFTFSFPTIPTRKVNPWINYDFYKSFQHKPLIHLRSRDFNTLNAVEDFLKNHKMSPELIDILVIYGDGSKKNSSGLAPAEIIPFLKSLGFTIGCVFNPKPVARNILQERESLLSKLKQNPDFMISQCVYDFKALVDFCLPMPPSIPIIIGLGFWPTNTNFEKLGINSLDSTGQSNFEPSKKLIENLLAWPKCFGIYICDYSDTT